MNFKEGGGKKKGKYDQVDNEFFTLRIHDYQVNLMQDHEKERFKDFNILN